MESTQHSVLHVAGVNTRGLFLSYGDRKFKWLKDLWSLNNWVGKPALLLLPGLGCPWERQLTLLSFRFFTC